MPEEGTGSFRLEDMERPRKISSLRLGTDGKKNVFYIPLVRGDFQGHTVYIQARNKADLEVGRSQNIMKATAMTNDVSVCIGMALHD